jgi:hypothetical protein
LTTKPDSRSFGTQKRPPKRLSEAREQRLCSELARSRDTPRFGQSTQACLINLSCVSTNALVGHRCRIDSGSRGGRRLRPAASLQALRNAAQGLLRAILSSMALTGGAGASLCTEPRGASRSPRGGGGSRTTPATGGPVPRAAVSEGPGILCR